MGFKLKEKENEFQVTKEGEFEYHRFKHGIIYDQVPPEHLDRFAADQEESLARGENTEGGEDE